ncbi:hypothetical protein Tco_0822360 [Tanacetum coccineum]|uniref:Uncharacterized protein n=1 Tax=Tanacetum coccineum TaxID=301880 RepID=A0ABQ5AEU2_9ASTR
MSYGLGIQQFQFAAAEFSLANIQSLEVLCMEGKISSSLTFLTMSGSALITQFLHFPYGPKRALKNTIQDLINSRTTSRVNISHGNIRDEERGENQGESKIPPTPHLSPYNRNNGIINEAMINVFH